jgi:hypothetical protein
MQRLGFVVPPLRIVDVGKDMHRIEHSWVVLPKDLLSNGKYLFAQGLGLIVFPLRLVDVREAAHGMKDIRVLSI